MAHIFISYSRKDIVTIKELIKFLKLRNYSTWRDEDNLEPGGNWTTGLELAIRESDLVLLVISSNSIQSTMVINEAMWAQNVAKKPVIPLVIEDVELPLVLYTTQYIPMFHNWMQGCETLDQRLREIYTRKVQDVSHKALVPDTNPPSVANSQDTNPFSSFGTAVNEDRFLGRADALSLILDRLSADALSSTSIVGERRIGKTSLLNFVIKRHHELLQQGYKWAFAYIDMSTAQASNPSSFMEVLRHSILEWAKFEAWSRDHDGDLEVLKRSFVHLKSAGVRLVLCMDEFEGSVAYDNALRPLFHELRSAGSNGEIAMLTVTRVSLIDLFAEWGRVSPFGNIFATARLKPMTKEEWERIVSTGFARTGHSPTADHLALIEELSGGHPYLVQIASFYAWQTKHLRWTQAEVQIREGFTEQARSPFFADLWIQQPNEAKEAIRSILGLPTSEPVKRKSITKLRERGLLNPTGDSLFCQPFVEYLIEELE